MNMGSHVAYFTTLFMEHLAQKNEGKLSLTHYYPKLVMTPAFGSERLPKWFRWVMVVMKPLLKLYCVSSEECGNRVLFLASERYPARGLGRVESKMGVAMGSDGVVGGGHYRCNWNEEVMESEKVFRKVKAEGLGENVVSHTLNAFEEIEKGGVFTG